MDDIPTCIAVLQAFYEQYHGWLGDFGETDLQRGYLTTIFELKDELQRFLSATSGRDELQEEILEHIDSILRYRYTNPVRDLFEKGHRADTLGRPIEGPYAYVIWHSTRYAILDVLESLPNLVRTQDDFGRERRSRRKDPDQKQQVDFLSTLDNHYIYVIRTRELDSLFGFLNKLEDIRYDLAWALEDLVECVDEMVKYTNSKQLSSLSPENEWFPQLKLKLDVLHEKAKIAMQKRFFLENDEEVDVFAEMLNVLLYMFDLPQQIDAKWIWSGEGDDTVVGDQVIYEVVQDPGDIRHIFQNDETWMDLIWMCFKKVMPRGSTKRLKKKYETLQRALNAKYFDVIANGIANKDIEVKKRPGSEHNILLQGLLKKLQVLQV